MDGTVRLGSTKTNLKFSNIEGTKSLLFGFASRSRVLFHKNDFEDSSIHISYVAKSSRYVQKLSWRRREAYIVKDDSYYEAMIRKNYGLPETVHLEIPNKNLNHLGLDKVFFCGKQEDGRLRLNM